MTIETNQSKRLGRLVLLSILLVISIASGLLAMLLWTRTRIAESSRQIESVLIHRARRVTLSVAEAETILRGF